MHGRDGGQGLRLSPFRGLRFAADGERLASVLCPPYDVVEPQRRAELAARDPHNVVRLTLPEARDPAAAAITLESWVSAGVLRPDDGAGLYVLDQCRGGRLWRGVVGAVHVDSAVLPHEDVIPHVVAERQALLGQVQTDLEPLLLTVEGGLGDALPAALETAEPVAAASLGGMALRLWHVGDADAQRHLSAAVAQQVALIADGHHRWTAPRRHATGLRRRRGPGPWDRCLALVVDSESDPLELGAIHRVLEGLDLETVRGSWADAVTWEHVSPDPAALERVVTARGPGTLALVDGRAGWLVSTTAVSDRLDVEWLHDDLLRRLGVAETAVSYHHSAQDAAAAATARGGLAVLCAPVPAGTVRSRAAAGRLLPRKATSFGPKPPSGLVMRRHRDDG